MVRPDLNATAEARIKGMVRLRDCVQELIDLQMDAATPDSDIREKQVELNQLYSSFVQNSISRRSSTPMFPALAAGLTWRP